MPNIERVVPVLTYQDIAAAHDFLVHGHRWWLMTPVSVGR